MADYYPLIARAVAGLEKNTGDGRRALYERARTALVAQLRGVTPALNESDVTRERLALEEAIRKVEAESARQAWVEQPAAVRQDPPNRVRPPQMPHWDEPLPGASADPQRRSPPPPSRNDAAPARTDGATLRRQPPRQPAPGSNGMFGNERYVDPVFDQPIADSQRPAAEMPQQPQRHPLRGRPSGERRSLLDAGLKDFRNVVSETDELGEASARSAKSARENYPDVAPSAQDLDEYQSEPPLRDGRAAHNGLLDVSAPRLLEPSLDDETRPPPRPYMPPPAEHEDLAPTPRRSFRDLIKIAVALLIVAGLGGALAMMWPSMAQFYRSLRTPSTSENASDQTPASQAGRSNKIGDRYEAPGANSQTAAVTPGAQSGASPGGTSVAQRVVLYEEDSSDPQGKLFVGSAIWRTEMVSPGPGMSPELAIRADVEIPERHISMTWSLRRNTDPNLPASHTVEIMFKLPPDFPPGGISAVPGILMKAGEQAPGAPLAGLVAKVTNGYFLIGLNASAADRDRNLQLLKERSWFDIPVVYNNHRRAILALEKGTPGERAFAEAFKVWKQ
jgi:hypothetical protein